MVSARLRQRFCLNELRTSFLVALTQKHKGVEYGYTCFICTNKIPIVPKD